VVPALAVAEALHASGARVEFLGGERAESELVPAAGYTLHELPAVGIDRRNPLRAARAIWLALVATLRARRLLRRLRPAVLVGGGGYIAGTSGLAAASLGVPIVLCEADSHLGVSNRLLARFARRVCLAFPVDGREGPRYLVTGRPVPSGTGTADGAAARGRFGIPPDARCLLVFGGSLGARSINEAALDAFGREAPCHVLHPCGRRDHAALRARLDELGSPAHYHLHPYIEPFADALAAADLAVARSGGSVFELAAAGLPALLVPYPHATGDHQAKNAAWMEEAGAAVVLRDAELEPARLRREVEALLSDPMRLEAMEGAARSLARPEAARVVADEALAAAR
jgi:UDP-N-acetylglucosamine--N-acetylmuramyl-(pentapeptide) pyrophosphoryl-undecaprenol N-acetylglucosamine transferase